VTFRSAFLKTQLGSMEGTHVSTHTHTHTHVYIYTYNEDAQRGGDDGDGLRSANCLRSASAQYSNKKSEQETER